MIRISLERQFQALNLPLQQVCLTSKQEKDLKRLAQHKYPEYNVKVTWVDIFATTAFEMHSLLWKIDVIFVGMVSYSRYF